MLSKWFSLEARVEHHHNAGITTWCSQCILSLFLYSVPFFFLSLPNLLLPLLALNIPNSWQMGFIDCLAYEKGYCKAQKAGSNSAFNVWIACLCSSHGPIIQMVPFAPGSVILIMERTHLKSKTTEKVWSYVSLMFQLTILTWMRVMGYILLNHFLHLLKLEGIQVEDQNWSISSIPWHIDTYFLFGSLGVIVSFIIFTW